MLTIFVSMTAGIVLGYLLFKKRAPLVEASHLNSDKEKKLEEEISKVWRLNTLGEMATGLAHELSQPIGAIKNYSVFLEKYFKDKDIDPSLSESIKGISNEAERASDFIHSLRSFIGSRTAEKQIEPINDLISDVLTLVKSELRAHKIEVKLKLTEPSLKVPIDKIQMIQVMLNLLRNSIDSLSSVTDGPREIFIGSTPQNRGVLLCVSDTGRGVPVTESPKLFDPFYTTKKGGMGMGLAISRTVIEIHEGKIWYVANEPAGATFMIWLPKAVNS